MPSLTSRIPELKTIGPIVEALIGPSSVSIEALQKENKTVPNPVVVRLLIDTGASISSIRTGIANQLGLTPHGTTKIATPSDHSYQVPLYDVDVLFRTHQIRIQNIRVIESPLKGQNIDGLIGRDILQLGVLIYTGYDNSFTIAF